MEILNKYIYDPKKDLIGKGGFSTVYKAYDKLLDLPVALKFFHAQDVKSKYNITNEIKRVIKLSHPNIIKFYGIETMVNRNFHGEEEDIQIGVMELAEEGQINIFFKQNKLKKEEIQSFFIDILEGMKYLHQQGIIHRDIKPQNILLAKDGRGSLVAKIADFGISKNIDANQTSASMLLGTVEYMAPEQFNPDKYGINKKISYNVDVWSFGVMAYFLLKNEFIFGGKSAETSPGEVINKIMNLDKLAEKIQLIEEPFKTLINTCLEPNANKRPTDIDELIAILKGEAYQPKTQSAKVEAKKEKKPHEIRLDLDETRIIDKQKAKIEQDNDATKIISEPLMQDNDATKQIDIVPSVSPTNDEHIVSSSSINNFNFKKIGLIAASALAVSVVGYLILGGKKGEDYSRFEPVLTQINSGMKPVASGKFKMGDVNSIPECECNVEKETAIKKPFKMLAFEITQGMWNDVMEDGRFKDVSLKNHPATNITWNETQQFLSKLNLVSQSNEGMTFRLPTEAEWEFACIGDSPFATIKMKLDDHSWNNRNTNKTEAVGQKKGNRFGIHDMLGNVYEWCEDWVDPNATEKLKVLRGGDFKNPVEFVDPYCRNRDFPNSASETIGFRIVQNVSSN